MFSFDLNALELVFRALIVYTVLLLLVRVTGKRTVGQFTPFDLLVVMLISETAGPAIMGSEESMMGGLLVCATLIGVNTIIEIMTVKNRAVEKFFEGEPVLLARDGVIFEGPCKKHRLSQHDMRRALREADCHLEDLHYAFLEVDGKVSIQKKRTNS